MTGFYLPAVLTRCSGEVVGTGTERKQLLSHKNSQSWAKQSRRGPVTEQTTGDRKGKIGDHKEALRQKPHDRRRQSAYLHAVPKRRCPSTADPYSAVVGKSWDPAWGKWYNTVARLLQSYRKLHKARLLL